MTTGARLDDPLPTELLQRARALRHELHRWPELGFAEHRTQARVRDWLAEHGYRPRACAGTGLVAELDGGRPGPVVALRADLDALPIDERTPLPYRSEVPGVAHKCGHDGHTAILCAVAARLAALRDRVPGTVRLLFQPAEEGVDGGGARVMVAAGALDGVAAVYGLHNWPGFPKGDVRVAPGTVMAQEHRLLFAVRGRGGHASEPQRCRDPIAAGARLVTALHTLVAREVGLAGGAVLSIGSFHAGTANNVIPDGAELRGTLRSVDVELGERLAARVREVAAGEAAAAGLQIDAQVERTYPAVVNDAACVTRVAAAAARVVGAGRVGTAGLPLAASEDFAYLAGTVPGCYFLVGAGAPVGATPGCHHPDFDFDDDLLDVGARICLGIVAAGGA
ncbi:MAG: amidohydrolase [Planctomycetes bacterium]|nr:amidohydrolase [Planctomycetota bacterium]